MDAWVELIFDQNTNFHLLAASSELNTFDRCGTRCADGDLETGRNLQGVRVQYENLPLCVAGVNELAAPVERRDDVQIALQMKEPFRKVPRIQAIALNLRRCPVASICVMNWCREERLRSASDTPSTSNRFADRIVLWVSAMGSGISGTIRRLKYPKCKCCCRSMRTATGK